MHTPTQFSIAPNIGELVGQQVRVLHLETDTVLALSDGPDLLGESDLIHLSPESTYLLRRPRVTPYFGCLVLKLSAVNTSKRMQAGSDAMASHVG
jgi:hypothetical protein